MRRLPLIWTILFLTGFLTFPADAEMHNVPDDFDMIQDAVEAAVPGDTILVAEGSYAENVNYRGKDLVIGSEFLLDGDFQHVLNTIIDGSEPAHPDTGSCVLMISGETRAAELVGFTLTGGDGTPVLDSITNSRWTEGGGVHMNESSPTVRHNLIIGNTVTVAKAGTGNAGGGGLRTGYGAPLVTHNIIMDNTGNYGGAVVVNESDAEFYNNIVIGNEVRNALGGGTFWVWGPGTASVYHNNTVAGNTSTSLNTAGMYNWGTEVEIVNCIFWGNDNQDLRGTQNPEYDVSYSVIEGGYENGESILDLHPGFAEAGLLLAPDSPLVDAGDPSVEFNDPEDPEEAGQALAPALGTITADIGAYGGPYTEPLLPFSRDDFTISTDIVTFNTTPVGFQTAEELIVSNGGSVHVSMDSAQISLVSGEGVALVNELPLSLEAVSSDTLTLTWLPESTEELLADLLIYHTSEGRENPLILTLIGDVETGVHDEIDGTTVPKTYYLSGSYPNPFNAVATVQFGLPTTSAVTLRVYNSLGREVATLLDGTLQAGVHKAIFNGRDLASGVYLVRMQTAGFVQVQPMVLTK
ncbi:T9SS type A sorting domain-containing protein [bacterium]|nr:T9SS type A sorting domain-containing protein [bacterium]